MKLNPGEELAKTIRHRLLYELGGRDEWGHPLHGRFTGLMEVAPSRRICTAASPAAAAPGPEDLGGVELAQA